MCKIIKENPIKGRFYGSFLLDFNKISQLSCSMPLAFSNFALY